MATRISPSPPPVACYSARKLRVGRVDARGKLQVGACIELAFPLLVETSRSNRELWRWSTRSEVTDAWSKIE